jgi:hypothetical protein
MKTTRKRLARLASFMGVTLLVLVAGVQAAFAAVVEGAGGSVGPVTAEPVGGASTAATTIWTVVAGVAVAALIVVVWAILLRWQRRRDTAAASEASSLDTFCAQNPASALCGP